MFENLLKSAEGPLKDLLANVGGDPGSAGSIKETFLEVIQSQAKSGNFDGIMEMFSGKDTDPDGPTVNNLKSDLSSGLSQKLGIDTGKAMSIAAAALPMLLNLFNKRVNDAPQPNEEIQESVVKSVKNGDGTGLGGILSSIFGADDDPNPIDLGGVIDFGRGLFKK